MDLNLSEMWMDLMEKENAFFQSAARYRMDIPAETRSRDMLASLNDEEGAKVVIRLLHAGYVPMDDLEIVWFKLVWCVFYSPFPYCMWAIESLKKIPAEELERFEPECRRLVNVYASMIEEDGGGDLPLLLGLKLLDDMGYHRSLDEYISLFNETMQLSAEETAEYTKKSIAAKEGDI